MYVKSLAAYNFRCFGKAELLLQYPGRSPSSNLESPNINLLLGNNGMGKSSVLRALAIASLAPILNHSGFVPYRLVRRPGSDTEALLKAKAILNTYETTRKARSEIELLARLRRLPKSSIDELVFERTPASPLNEAIYDATSPAFFVAGYGATRSVEVGEYSASSARKRRGRRYERVASLFEDHVALQPLTSWLPRTALRRKREVISLLNQLLPEDTRFSGRHDRSEDQYIFDYRERPTPFPALSDGYKAFIGWIGDLLCHLCECCPSSLRMVDMPGLVLIDEIDLHLHPEWQRAVVPAIARTLPNLQFVMTSHSPIVVGTLRHENIFVTEYSAENEATVAQYAEKVHGRSAEQLLLSSYFGLNSTRAESFTNETEKLFNRAAQGDTKAAIEYLDRLTEGTSRPAKRSPAPAKKRKGRNSRGAKK